MSTDRQALFTEVAHRALDAYGLADAPYTYLQHSENVTFKVDLSDGGTRLLRIHVPRVALMGKHGANVEMVNSELVWLEALRRETDLPVQQPVRNADGQFVTRIHKGKRQFNCTLLEWLEGEPYQRALENEETVAQLGTMIATMHRFSSQWQRPAGFTRPSRDRAYFKKALDALRPTTEDGRASYQDFKRLEMSVDTLIRMMRSLPKKDRTEGILHGDLHKGNFLYHQGQMRLIDFSMSAMGNYMFDLGVCLSDMNLTLHPVFLENYQKLVPLPSNYERLIEAFFVGSMVMTFSFWVTLPEGQEELVRKIPLIAQEYAAKLNRDERFWFRA
jgi:Ser/Thr protein kinase RdoA (MazF antagonist)